MWQTHLQQSLERWRGTPWVAGQQLRGPRGGVDCVRFVVGVLDELFRLDLPNIPRLPQDMSLHDREGAMRVARAIEERYPHTLIESVFEIEPGDVIVLRTGAGAGPGHVLIAGSNPKQLWHASERVGVTTTSLAMFGPRFQVVRIWRPEGKDKW